MTVRAHLATVLVVSALSACQGDQGPAIESGWITIARGGLGAARLVDGPARATFCPLDSSLLIMGRNERWFGAIGARLAWPLSSRRELPVATSLERPGSGAAAVRPLEDSVGAALVALRGTVVLEADSVATGTFDVIAEESPGKPVRLYGEFRAVAVLSVCAGP